jgi:undecaprenyl phosphate-alpha-L-ara4N flippase subunit ArnF
MTTFLWLLLATALTVIGDYLIKLSTALPQGIRSAQFALGALCYGLPAFAWFAMMREHNLAAIAVFYSAATLVILAAMGIVVFKEPFSWRDGLGVSLALAAVVVMQTGE